MQFSSFWIRRTMPHTKATKSNSAKPSASKCGAMRVQGTARVACSAPQISEPSSGQRPNPMLSFIRGLH